MALREHRERAQHVGVALARDEMRDRDERLSPAAIRRAPPLLAPARGALAALPLCGGQLGAEVQHARLARTVCPGELRDAMAVGKHERGRAKAARHRLGAILAAPGGVEHVAAVHRDDHRTCRRARRTASAAGTALCACTSSNGNERATRRSASASGGAAHAPHAG